jgi:hypothetical protein
MNSENQVSHRQEHPGRPAQEDVAEASAVEDDQPEAVWEPPQRSDQAPGEETVQVNDAYTGNDAPPIDESHGDDEQHPTGG